MSSGQDHDDQAPYARASANPPAFVISLDFELFWGIRDHADLEACKARLNGTREAIPRLLDLFAQKGIHATWATVGFLFFDEKDELLAHLPALKPSYQHQHLSPYPHLSQIGPNERKDPYHYGRSLIRRIGDYPGQEIGTHTFSHYYCLEEGQTIDEFRADLEAARGAARLLGLEVKSLIFPRNQWRPEYLEICAKTGISVVRSNEQAWMYRAGSRKANSTIKRALRLADNYVNLSGHHGARPALCEGGLIDVPSSRFLRPFTPGLARLEPFRLERIRQSMTDAAKNGLTFHLWWHPHNFGMEQNDNFRALSMILDHFGKLSEQYGMTSRSMGELASDIRLAA